jgi:hypothetical protein
MNATKKEYIRQTILDAKDKLDNATKAIDSGDYPKAIRELNAAKEDTDFMASEIADNL